MDALTMDFIAGVFDRGLLGSVSTLPPDLVDDYWSGKFGVPRAIECDVDAYLSTSSQEPLWRAASWVVRSYFLSGHHPNHHVALVRLLFEEGKLEARELPSLLALTSAGEQLEEDIKDIVWISLHLVEEGRLEEAESMIPAMLLAASK